MMVGRKTSFFAMIAVAAAVSLGFTHGHELCAGFLPENDMKIPVGQKGSGGLTQEQFNAVIDSVEEIYKPIVASKGGKLVVERKWEDPTVNAYANRGWGGTWNVAMFGGLARHSAVTPDGFALVVCHEIGHHLGGFPKKFGWASNEGQADYFATLKCLRRVYGSGALSKGMPQEDCDDAHGGGGGSQDCQRNAQAGLSIAKLFQALRNLPEPPEFTTPDESVAERMDNNHPQPQCRLDTYYQGGLCTKGLGEDVDDSNPLAGTCNRVEGYSVGVRPLCWYKPPQQAKVAAKVPLREKLPDAEALSRRISALRASLDAS